LDALYRPVAGKPFELEVLCLDMGTSVASALTAETIVEIMKCISDVDMRGRGRMGTKSEILRFFNSGYTCVYRHDPITVVDASIPKNPREYPHNVYIGRNQRSRCRC